MLVSDMNFITRCSTLRCSQSGTIKHMNAIHRARAVGATKGWARRKSDGLSRPISRPTMRARKSCETSQIGSAPSTSSARPSAPSPGNGGTTRPEFQAGQLDKCGLRSRFFRPGVGDHMFEQWPCEFVPLARAQAIQQIPLNEPPGLVLELLPHALENQTHHIQRDEAVDAARLLDAVEPTKEGFEGLLGKPSAAALKELRRFAPIIGRNLHRVFSERWRRQRELKNKGAIVAAIDEQETQPVNWLFCKFLQKSGERRPLLRLIKDQEFLELVNNQQQRGRAFFRAGNFCLCQQTAQLHFAAGLPREESLRLKQLTADVLDRLTENPCLDNCPSKTKKPW